MLFGVFLDEFFEDVLAHERERLFFEVCGLAAVQGGDGFCLLLFDFCLGFSRRRDAPHLVERVHVERQVVKLAFVIRDRAVRVAVEFDDGIYEIPYLLVARMENVGAVFMDVDALDIFAIDVSTQLCALVDDEALFAHFVGAVCKSCPEKAGTDNQIIVFFYQRHFLSLFQQVAFFQQWFYIFYLYS